MHLRSNAAVRGAYSAIAYALFLGSIGWSALFLTDRGPLPTVDSPRTGPAWSAVVIDVGLWLVFALHHSVLARASVKERLSRVLPERVERSTYVLVASLALALILWQWRALPASIWQLDAGPWATSVWAVYAIGWVITVASTYLTDHWELFGLRQAGWLAARPESSTTVSRRLLYAWVRHPMMVGMFIAFWATPNMTAGHLLFALAASVYIAVGTHFEERDLRRNLGVAYDEYAEQVARFIPKPRGFVTVSRRSTGS